MTEESIESKLINDLSDHSTKLNEILRVGNSIINRFQKDKAIGNSNALTKDDLNKMLTILFNALFLAGKLSSSRHEIQKDMEDHYIRTYAHSPALGHKLYLKHYFGLLKPYDRVKNKLWKFIFTIEAYKDKHY